MHWLSLLQSWPNVCQGPTVWEMQVDRLENVGQLFEVRRYEECGPTVWGSTDGELMLCSSSFECRMPFKPSRYWIVRLGTYHFHTSLLISNVHFNELDSFSFIAKLGISHWASQRLFHGPLVCVTLEVLQEKREELRSRKSKMTL